MAEYLVQGESLSQIADAVRASTGSTDPLTLDEMAAVISQMSAGGGSELVIVGGTTRPANPNQNTIWIDTDAEITSYVLSATEPANPIEGMAWVIIGDSGNVKMASPVGGDWITVYPISAKQYISGIWVNKTAKSYQNGEWVDWFVYLYNNGVTKHTFVAEGKKYTSSSYSIAVTPTITKNSNNIYLSIDKGSNANGSAGIVYISEAIDLTNFSKLVVEGDFYTDGNIDYPSICVWSKIGTYQSDNLVAEKTTVDTVSTMKTATLKVDISNLSEAHYIGVYLNTGTGTCYARIRDMHLQ